MSLVMHAYNYKVVYLPETCMQLLAVGVCNMYKLLLKCIMGILKYSLIIV